MQRTIWEILTPTNMEELLMIILFVVMLIGFIALVIYTSIPEEVDFDDE